MQRNSWLILGALCLCASPVDAQANCDDLQADKPGDAKRAFECLEIAQSDLITAQDRIDALEARMGDLASLAARIDALETSGQSAVAVPALGDHPDTRAVVAYVSAKGEKTCPKGWEPFEAAKGRFILGAGAAYPVVGTLGGEAEVALSEAQMPKHNHKGGNEKLRVMITDGRGVIPSRYPSDDSTGPVNLRRAIGLLDAGGGPNSDYGESEPHNNIPPFIALYFCQPSG